MQDMPWVSDYENNLVQIMQTVDDDVFVDVDDDDDVGGDVRNN